MIRYDTIGLSGVKAAADWQGFEFY